MPNSSSDEPVVLELTLKEAFALYRILEFQYIPRDNLTGYEIVTRIAQIVREHEQQLARLSSRATQGA